MSKQQQIEHMKIKPSDRRNEMHFEVQLRNRAQIFRNRKKYWRKAAKKIRPQDIDD